MKKDSPSHEIFLDHFTAVAIEGQKPVLFLYRGDP